MILNGRMMDSIQQNSKFSAYSRSEERRWLAIKNAFELLAIVYS